MNIEKVLKIKFSPKQKASATAVRWLLNDGKKSYVNGVTHNKNRQTGRSLVMLSLIIEKALKERGKPVPIIDHTVLSNYHTYSTNRFMKDRVVQMLAKAKISNYRIAPASPTGAGGFALIIN